MTRRRRGGGRSARTRPAADRGRLTREVQIPSPLRLTVLGLVCIQIQMLVSYRPLAPLAHKEHLSQARLHGRKGHAHGARGHTMCADSRPL